MSLELEQATCFVAAYIVVVSTWIFVGLALIYAGFKAKRK